MTRVRSGFTDLFACAASLYTQKNDVMG